MIRLEPIICEMTATLAASLSELHGTCFPDDPWPPRAMVEINAMSGVFGHIAFVCERAEEVASGLALAHRVGGECELLTLGVVPPERRTGIGKALLASVIEEARRQSAHTLFLEVAEDNVAGRTLYAARGFVQIGRRTNYYRRPTGLADALVLRLLLTT